MNPQEIEKLLGGYATDTLTEEERRTLFAAALDNQALFDALADEQALRELLDDPASRAHLLTALRQDRVTPLARLLAWLRQPSAIALAAAVAAGLVTIAVLPRKTAPEKPAAVALNVEPQKQVQTEMPVERTPEPKPAAPSPAGSPRPAVAEKADKVERDVFPLPAKPAEPVPASTAAAPPPPPPAPAPVVAQAPMPTPPPAPAMAPPARSQFKASEPVAEQQDTKAKAADAVAPAAAGGALATTQELRKKEAAATTATARTLYYSSRAAGPGGLLDQPAAGLGGSTGFGRARPMANKNAVARRPADVIGGVRYSILKRSPDGSFVEVDPSTVFAPGDALRVRFETNQAGNLSVMERKADATWNLRLAMRTVPGQAVYMPADGAIDVTASGGFRLFVRFSRSVRSEARLDQVTPTANLLRETASNSVYVVNPVAAADPVVDFELAINAR